MRYLLLVIAILWVCAGCMRKEEAPLQIMTYNIKYDDVNDTINNWEQRKIDLVKLIEIESPDFVGLQEAMHHQLMYLKANLTPYSHIGVGRTDGGMLGEYSAILFDSSKFELLKNKTIWLSPTPSTPSRGWDAAYPRVCTYGLFKNKKTNRDLWVFNTHLDHVGVEAREASSQLILKAMQVENGTASPMVLLGDFNALSTDQPIQILAAQLDDALKISDTPLVGPVGTFNGFATFDLQKRIDYIFTQGFRVLSYEHMDKRRANGLHISDHLPVLVALIEN